MMTKLFEKQQKFLVKVDRVLLAAETGSSIDKIWDPIKQKQDVICDAEKVTPITNTKTFPRIIV